MKYTIPRKGANALINQDIDRALGGTQMGKAVAETSNRARNTYIRKGPRHLRGAVTVSTETRRGRRIGVVQVIAPSALAVEFGSKRNGGRGTHAMRSVAEELNS